MAGPFELALRQFAKDAGERADVAVREVVLEVANRLIYRSPVDTGRFRGNWFYSLDQLERGLTTGPEPEVAAAIYQGADVAVRYAAVLQNTSDLPVKAAGSVHYIQNNLPYAWPLERGHSSQAPHGMVGLTVQDFKGITDDAVKKARSK